MTCIDAVEKCTKNELTATLISVDEFCLENPKKYDFIIMSHVLEHIDKRKVIKTLESIKHNLLAEGGSLFIAVPNAQSNTGCYWAYEDFTHSTLFTAGSILYVLKAAGFQDIQFIDIDCTAGSNFVKNALRKTLLSLYKFNLKLSNFATGSYFHAPSPKIFSYEIKVMARL